jgi:imidazole glycerol-phosphate synthase subunit HisF
MLSRNFRLQKVGSLNWLKKNYDFSHISFYIDELIVLDVSRGERSISRFSRALELLSEGCFVPIAAGGGIRTIEDASQLLRSGADKVVVNTPLFKDRLLLRSLVTNFGRQCVVGSVDLKKFGENEYQIWINSGAELLSENPTDLFRTMLKDPPGEIYLNSIDQDGTGQGFDLTMLGQLPDQFPSPIILAGGAGNSKHLAEALIDLRVDAVATANLFNFVGDGLMKARKSVDASGIVLAKWPDRGDYLGNSL